MPLIQTLTGFTAATGSSSTIVISASDTTIQAVTYGQDATGAPIFIPVSTNSMSFQINILSGLNTLQVDLVTPGPGDDGVIFSEEIGPNLSPLDYMDLVPLAGSWLPAITGTP